MQISASTFSDPTMRAGLQEYYEKQKAAAVAGWKARENQPLGEVRFTTPDGKLHTGTMIPISADKLEKAFVSFDKWLEFQAETFDNAGMGPGRLAMAQKRLDDLVAHSPDTSSNVRTTFSVNGQLLAYINADGTLVTSNIGPKHGAKEAYTPVELKIAQLVDTLGLAGERRIDYLNHEVKKVLAKEFGNVTVTSYGSANSPTKRDFAKMWSPNFDVDQVYKDALAGAQAGFDEANAWYKQWQTNMNGIQSFLLGLQEVA